MLVTDLSSHELNPKHYFYSVGLVLALLFALLDHNPEQLGFPLLLASWLLQGLLPVSLLILCQQRLEHVPALQQRAAWLKLLLCGLCASLLFAGPALLLDVALGLDPQYQGWQHWATAWWHEVLAVAPLITVAWIAANAPGYLASGLSGHNLTCNAARTRPMFRRIRGEDKLSRQAVHCH